jgi:LPS-assembly lipoprotein
VSRRRLCSPAPRGSGPGGGDEHLRPEERAAPHLGPHPNSPATTRRTLLVLASGAAVSACGFEPIYMRTASGDPGPAQRELAAIHVNLMGDRPGMLLRQALQSRFEGAGDSTQRRYDLTVSYWVSGQALGVQQDTTITYIRFIGTANFTLNAQDPAHTLLLSGSARAFDAMNTFDSQLFAQDLESESIQRTLAEHLADQITLQLAVFFRRRAVVAAS